jgi:hypothetical protein
MKRILTTILSVIMLFCVSMFVLTACDGCGEKITEKPQEQVEAYVNLSLAEKQLIVGDEALLVAMQQAWGTEYGQLENAVKTRKQLEKCPTQHTQFNSFRAGVVYANADLGLVYRRNQEDSLPLLENENTADVLRALADPALRKILQYQILREGDGRAFTAASMAVKCGIREEEAEAAFQALFRFRFAQMQEVETGADVIRVYSLWGSHKLPLLYAFFSLAGRLADFQENYYGLRS